MSDSFTFTPTIPVDPAGHVNGDVACLGCGYNLRTLHQDGLCPECAMPVGRSLKGDLLMFQDPRWVEKVSNGMNWIIAAIAVGIILGVLVSIGSGASAARGGAGSLLGISLVASVIVQILYLIGYWRFTEPEPGKVDEAGNLNVRQVIRVTAILNLVLVPLQHGVGVRYPLNLVVVTIGAVSGAVCYIGMFVYARRLALRVPNESLASQTRVVMWGLVIGYGAAAIAGLGAIINLKTAFTPGAGTGTSGSNAMWVILGVFGCGAAIAMAVFGIWALVLIFRYRKALADAAFYARATWASGSAPGLLQPMPPTPPDAFPPLPQG